MSEMMHIERSSHSALTSHAATGGLVVAGQGLGSKAKETSDAYSGTVEPPRALWKCALVYGLGVSGAAVSRLLLQSGTSVLGVEDKPDFEVPEDLAADQRFQLLATSEGVTFDTDTVDLVVVSPGVPTDRKVLQRALDAGHQLRAEVEVAYQLLNATHPSAALRIAGITGSNGKSTTTQLVEELLGRSRARACGNIGVPLSDCVRELQESRARGDNREGFGEPSTSPVTHVVELSSFQLENVDQFRASAATLLNLSPDHLDRHGSTAAYVDAKRQIFKAQRPGDLAVLNKDDEISSASPTNDGVRRRYFSLLGPVDDGCFVDGESVYLTEPGEPCVKIFDRSDLALVGDHNLANAMAALLLALPFDLDLATVPATLANFPGLPHRTRLVAENDGVRWYDDSKGTNVGAAEKSLQGFADGTVHLIAGGRAKGGDFRGLREVVGSKAVRLYLIGEAADQLETDLGDLVPVERTGTMTEAVRRAACAAKPGEVVLLSPACASFDQFANFAERGLAFQRDVEGIVQSGHRDHQQQDGGEHG